MAHSEKTLDSRMIFDGKVIRVTLDRVELENGDVITWRGKTLTVRAVRPDYARAVCEMDCLMEA